MAALQSNPVVCFIRIDPKFRREEIANFRKTNVQNFVSLGNTSLWAAQDTHSQQCGMSAFAALSVRNLQETGASL